MEIKRICEFLEPFKHASLEVQADRYPTISHVLPWYDFLLDHSEGIRDNTNVSESLHDSASAAFDKLEKYYNISSEHLTIAILLDPRLKLHFFAAEGKDPVEVREQQRIAERHFRRTFDKYSIQHDVSRDVNPRPTYSNRTPFDRFEIQDDHQVDEVENYLKLRRAPRETQSLVWWKDHQAMFPVLAKMARDFMAIPATSAPSERCFSASGGMVSVRRTRLSDDSVESGMCLRNWLRQGLVKSQI